MKKYIIWVFVFCLTTIVGAAQEIVPGVRVNYFETEINGNYLDIKMALDVSNIKVKKNKAILLTPCIINGQDSIHLKSIGIYGRKRYYHYKRNNGKLMLSKEDEMVFRKRNLPSEIKYQTLVNNENWMISSDVLLKENIFGCCENLLSLYTGLLGELRLPNLIYIFPLDEEKQGVISGCAYVDFAINNMVINPDYRNNFLELTKVDNSIDKVKNDSDLTIQGVTLKGFASPEGSYKHNTYLAKGRTEALKDYILGQYDFSSDDIKTSYESENWEGLKKYVETSNLEHKAEILDLINSDMEPDAKEAKIKATYPTEYKYLLDNCYPELRRTDYHINYTIRKITDLEEIRRYIEVAPEKLSLTEMYLLAQNVDANSKEYDNIFYQAVKTYPSSEIANLNAANIAIKNNNLSAAKKYLSKAGDSKEANYARGIMYYLQKDYPGAKEYFSKAALLGVLEAIEMLEKIK